MNDRAPPGVGGAVGAVTDRARPRPRRMLAITGLWGACYVAISWGLRDATDLWFATLRAAVAAAALLVVVRAQHRPTPRRSRDWLLVAGLALGNVAVAFGGMFVATGGVATGVASVLANTQALLVLLPAWWLFGERIDRADAVALGVGLAGLFAVAGGGVAVDGAVLSLVAAAGITSGTLLARAAAPDLDVVAVTAWHFAVGAAMLAAAAFVIDGVPAVAWTPRFVGSLGFLALAGTALAFLLWFEEVRRAPLGPLTAWTLLVPVFGWSSGLRCSTSGSGPGPSLDWCWSSARSPRHSSRTPRAATGAALPPSAAHPHGLFA